jgi:haloacid dehalogenase superfamily, subfamily IA, variant 3 with third motif having DD or ED
MIRFLRPFDPSRLSLLIFDLDGTLIDSRLDLIHSVNAALRHIGRDELDGDVIASYVGDGAPALMRRAVGEGEDENLLRRALEYFLGYYRLHKLDHTTVYEGIPELLASVADPATPLPAGTQGIDGRKRIQRQMAVLSNKPVNPSRDIVRAFGLNDFFVRIYGGNSFETKKPHPLGVRTILEETGVSPEQALMIGDSSVDVLTGRNAGMWTCGVTYGFAPDTLVQVPPDVLLDSPHELRDLLH